MKPNKKATKGTYPAWDEAMEWCRYCGTVGSPAYKICVECHVYKKFIRDISEELNPYDE